MNRVHVLIALLIFPFCQAYGDQVMQTQTTRVNVSTLASGLEHPWGLDFLPNGNLLVTERPGRLRIVNRRGVLSTPIRGVPSVYAEGQGGLLDVALTPDFTSSRELYLTYAEADGRGRAGTAVMRARLVKQRLINRQVIFRQLPKLKGPNHFGSRLVFARDGTLFVTLADRFRFQRAQKLVNHQGKVIRINRDGSIPTNNPFLRNVAAKPEIWSYGHRNVEGAALHPQTGDLWISELGPRGGDEINIPRSGLNYGWPMVSWGEHYDGTFIPPPSSRPDLSDAAYHWTPSVSPSGISFYTGSLLPTWRGNLLVGALSGNALVRLTLQGNNVTGEERIALNRRIRSVRQGPDGAVYLLTDEADGEILRLTP